MPQQDPAIATGLQPELPIHVKSLMKSEKLETQGTATEGLEIILEIGGQQLQTTTRIQGNTAIVNIPNTVLQLPDGN
ncbi:hypothetical protein [Tychonema sp. BBK16]|uniref:hypothetical protein n=1 Tax=Tychonema sp. BBK16 TaxID=2699888 RepID=UPI001F37D020|nr:hypothetical protein [Tychonema sp. BBK16]MCF6372446.1 hypothetical protein [Tychonema sp. BBK16]